MSYLSIDKQNNLLPQIKQYNQKLNAYQYGFLVNGKKSEDYDKYRTISPEELERTKIGTCWDYVELEAKYLSSLGFICTVKPLEEKQYSLYYIELEDNDGDQPTHSWLGFKLNGKYYAFESSWKQKRGIHIFNSEKDMINTYEKWHKLCYQKNGIKSRILMKYKPKRKYNQSCYQYMHGIHTNGVCYLTDKNRYIVKYKL